MAHGKHPETLIEALAYFREYENCHDFLVGIRWPSGVRWPHCGSPAVRYMESVRRWKCYEKHERPQFSLKTGTIFEESPVTLRKWLAAVWMIVNCKNGIRSYEIHREIGVTQKTAWFMGHRIRTAIQVGSFERLLGEDGGEDEVDETFIGGRRATCTATRRRDGSPDAGQSRRQWCLGCWNVEGSYGTGNAAPFNVKCAAPLPPAQRSTATIWRYKGLDQQYAHQTVDHAIQYVDGRVHTNGLENFRSLLKRALNGTYVIVEPFHLFRHIDEQAYRYNQRKLTNGEPLLSAVCGIFGNRLMYDELRGREGRRGPTPTPSHA